MDCAEFRRVIGANPKRASPEIDAHLASCAGCAKYAADMQRVDQLVSGALAVAGPKRRDPPWAPRPQAMRWYAIAASVLVIISAALVFWTGTRRDALIAEVVTHADRERSVMVASDKRVTEDKLQKALAKVGAQLVYGMPVSVARICKIRGVVATHFIMQTRDGAVAVLVMPREHTWLSHSFAEQGYQGRLFRKDGHAIAVVGKSEAAVKEGAALASVAIQFSK